MKKKIFILALTSILLFGGCKKKNANKKGDVVNDLVLKANTQEIKKNIYSDFNLANKELPIENISKVFYESGFLIITDTDGKLYFYSTIKEALICGPVTENNYLVYTSTVAGGYLRVTEGGVTNIYDGLGNHLITDMLQSFTVIDISNTGYPSYKGYYVDIRVDTAHHYFTYNSDGTATLVTTISGDGNDDFGPGSSMQGITYESLKNYGHEGYKLFQNSSRYIVFDKNNQEVSSFSDPNGEAEFFVGDYMYYQNSIKLKDTDTNYDYIDQAGDKYSLETYKINYLTAKKESVNLKYVLGTSSGDIKPFFSEKGVYSYVYANVRTISNKKILNNTVETYIIDSSGALHDNVTGIDLGSFERFGNNYYNTSSKTIYDGNLNEISILSGVAVSKSDNASLIVGQVNGNYGAINSQGKVVIPFEYSMIYSDYLSDNRCMAIYNGQVVVVGFDAVNCTSSILHTYEGYGIASYTNGGVFYVKKNSVTDVYYASLFSDSPMDLRSDTSATFNIMVTIANVINKAELNTLETSGGALVLYRAATVNISR